MSPAAVDRITLPPLDPPTPSATSSSAASRNEPSFHDQLQQAERRSGEADAARREPKTDDRSSSPSESTEARGPQENTETDKPQEKKSDEPHEKSDAVAGAKDKKQDADGEGDEKKKDDTGAECVVAAVVVPQEIDPTAELKVDTVEIATGTTEMAESASAIVQAAATQAAATVAEAAAIVVQPTAVTTNSQEAATPIVTTAAVATEVESVVAPQVVVTEKPTVEPTKIAAAEQLQLSELHATPTTAAAVAPTIVPAAAAVAAATTAEADVPTGDEAKETKVEAAAPAATSTVDAVVQQIIATTEAVVDSVTGNSEERVRKRDDNQHRDHGRIESHKETTRIDRPHQPEPARGTNGRETGAARAATNEGSGQLSQSDRVRLVERVARAVRTAEQRGGDLKIRLSPPELGSLKLQVKMTDGTLSARIEAETPEARQVLVDNLPQLRERLSDQNIRVEKFDIDLFNSGYGGAPQHSREEFDQAMFAAGQRRGNRSAISAETAAAATSRNSAGSTARGDGRLDITI